jgi:hypothetical protein
MRCLACWLALALAVAACGDDDDDDVAAIDAAAGAPDSVPGAPDGGTQGLGQFCGTLPDGGPHCIAGLDCCSDTLTCREPDDCGGSPGFLPCTVGSDCPSSKICCDVDGTRFCTKQSACADYGGTEIP